MALDMSSLFSRLAASTALLFASATVAPAGEFSCQGIDEAFLARHLPFKVSAIAAQREAPGSLCEVIVRADEDVLPMYASLEKDLVIAGDLFRRGTHVTLEGMRAIRKKEIAKLMPDLEGSVAFTHKPEGATGYVYFFSDPECSHCESAKTAARQWADAAKVELRVVLYPVETHPVARGRAVRAVCAGMTYDQYLSNTYGTEECDAGRARIDLASRTAEALGITGTPTFMNVSGDLAMGFNPAELRALLR